MHHSGPIRVQGMVLRGKTADMQVREILNNFGVHICVHMEGTRGWYIAVLQILEGGLPLQKFVQQQFFSI